MSTELKPSEMHMHDIASIIITHYIQLIMHGMNKRIILIIS